MEIIDKILFNLQTISSISKGDKISIAKEFITITDNSVFQPFYRKINGDDRDKSVIKITQEIETAIFISELIIESNFLATKLTKYHQRVAELKKIYSGLSLAVNGINNICDTYFDDANVVAHLTHLISKIRICCRSIKNTLLTENAGEIILFL